MNFNSHVPSFARLILVLTCSIAFGQSLDAQQIMDVHMRFNQAKDLYHQKAYQAARAAFAIVRETPYLAESSYFMASSAIRSGHEDGEELMNQFIASYPHHLYTQGAYLDIANFFFNKGQYEQALENFRKSNVDLTSESIFRKGYCEFFLNQYDEALGTFSRLDGSFTPYEQDAAYFKGFILHSRGKYIESYSLLTQAFESSIYRMPAMELYTSSLYQNGEYHKLIDLVDSELTPVENGAVLNLMANSQYKLEKYRSAAKNYQELFESFEKYRNEKNYFRAGFSLLKIEKPDEAIKYLKKSAIADDSVGAYASYYLGKIYWENKNLPFAITSFENTARFSTTLKEDALYYQAKCLMESPNYEGAIEVLNTYKANHSIGKFTEPVNEMLGVAYAQTNNYDLALSYIEELDRLTPQLKRTYQRVSFLKGVALFNDKKFDLAAEFFQKSLIHDEYQEITQQTYYWMGETLSLLDKEDEAQFYYQNVSQSPNAEIYLKGIYGRAYCHFNLKEYGSAASAFRQFDSEYISQVNLKYRADALIRLGDCYFALKEYQAGIDAYKKAENAGSKNKSRIYFQIGLLSRYLDDDRQAKQYFNKLVEETPESPQADHAFFQMAQIDFENGNEKRAIEAYNHFVLKYPTSAFIPFALLSQAIAYDNEGEYKLSIANYMEILNRFPRHQTANSALLGLQDKSANGQFDEFDQYLQKYKQANPNSQALENIEFESARANYYNQNYELTIQGLDDFIVSYPNSSLIPESKYLIGESYFRMGQLEKSLSYLQMIERLSDFPKYPKVLYRLATLQGRLGDFTKSNSYYYLLRNTSRSARNVINVQNGLMQNSYALNLYDSAIHYGNALLQNPRADVLIGAQANLIIGKSEYALGNHEKALQSLLPLVSNAPDERGAEAYYYISKIYFDQAKYDLALESLFILTNNFKSYESWLGQAYLLMADIYIETNELFQAKATLNSLIEHSALEEVRNKAEAKLSDIADVIDSNE